MIAAVPSGETSNERELSLDRKQKRIEAHATFVRENIGNFFDQKDAQVRTGYLTPDQKKVLERAKPLTPEEFEKSVEACNKLGILANPFVLKVASQKEMQAIFVETGARGTFLNQKKFLGDILSKTGLSIVKNPEEKQTYSVSTVAAHEQAHAFIYTHGFRRYSDTSTDQLADETLAFRADVLTGERTPAAVEDSLHSFYVSRILKQEKFSGLMAPVKRVVSKMTKSEVVEDLCSRTYTNISGQRQRELTARAILVNSGEDYMTLQSKQLWEASQQMGEYLAINIPKENAKILEEYKKQYERVYVKSTSQAEVTDSTENLGPLQRRLQEAKEKAATRINAAS
jgi:hypothetical protein